MESVFITGGSGLLGSNIAKIVASKFNVYAAYNKNKVSINNVDFFQIDLVKRDNLSMIEALKPNLIIHCAALANLDYCEEHSDEAYNQNVVASINVAQLAKKVGSYLIHVSTDGVFDGQKGGYKEEDRPNPITVYGKTKLKAEQEVLSIYPNACILRTNIYGWNKINKFSLAEWMINKLTNNEELPGLKDAYFSIILVNSLKELLLKLYVKKYKGIIHIAGNQSCSKLNFAYMLAEVFGFDSNLIKPIGIDELRLKVIRPKDLSLDVSRAERILQQPLPAIREDLAEMKRLRDSGYVQELKHG